MIGIESYIPYAASFLFVFAIVYAVLSESKVIKVKNANALIAAVFGIFAAVYQPFVNFIGIFIPGAAVVFILVFFLLVLKKAFKGEGKDALPSIAGLIIMLILAGVFWPEIEKMIPYSIGSENVLYIVGIIIIAFIFYAVYSHKS